MARKSEWAEMRISGLLGWVHRFVMLITFPFRKFWQILFVTLVLLVIAIAVPLCNGVKIHEVWDWYQKKLPINQIAEIKEDATNTVGSKIASVKEKIQGIIPGEATAPAAKQEENEEGRFVSWNVAQFKKAQYKPKKKIKVEQPVAIENSKTFSELKNEAQELKNDNIAEVSTDTAISTDTEISASDAMPEVGDLSAYYRRLKNRDLAYVTKPEVLYDVVDVVGANNIYINDTYIYLYGIYTDPGVYDEEKAKAYLETLTEGRKVRCDIVAYTVQTQSATALCFVGNIFINKAMVEQKHAGNVALK